MYKILSCILKRSLSFFLATVTVIGSLFFSACSSNSGGREISVKHPVLQDTLVTIPSDTSVTVIAVGDIMLGSAYKSVYDLPADSGVNSFKQVKPFLKEGNVVFGNLEGCLLDTGNSTKCKLKKNCLAFRSPENYVRILKDAGFNLLSLANNHAGDFGDIGRTTTLKRLQESDIKCGGLIKHPSSVLEVKGVKYGFCSFSPNDGTLSIYDRDNISKLIGELKATCDIVIVSFHGGGEGKDYQHVTRKTEFYFSEDRANPYSFAHYAIDAGADLVLGQGPHVTRAVEVYHNKFIAYSLGNFCTYGLFSLQGPNGYAPLLKISITKQGDFIQAKVHSVMQTDKDGLTIDSTGRAYQKIVQLTGEDFPGHSLNFSSDGVITPKPMLQ